MSASSRLQEEKDIALASSKIALEKDGRKLSEQAELNISNKVEDLDSITGGGIGGLFGAISGGFSSLLSNALSSISSLAGFAPSAAAAISSASEAFSSQSDSIASLVDQTKAEDLNNRVDKNATILDPYRDQFDVITYKDFQLMQTDIANRKDSDGTVLKNEKTRAYYVAVEANNGKFFSLTLFNYNKLRKRNNEPQLVPTGAVFANTIDGVKQYEGKINS